MTDNTTLLTRAEAESQNISVPEPARQVIAELTAALRSESDGREDAHNVLRSLASWVGNGGYNAPEVNPELFERKIRDGFDTILRVEAARRWQADPLPSDDEQKSILKRVNREFELRIKELERRLAVYDSGGFKDADALAAKFIETTERIAELEQRLREQSDELAECRGKPHSSRMREQSHRSRIETLTKAIGEQLTLLHRHLPVDGFIGVCKNHQELEIAGICGGCLIVERAEDAEEREAKLKAGLQAAVLHYLPNHAKENEAIRKALELLPSKPEAV